MTADELDIDPQEDADAEPTEPDVVSDTGPFALVPEWVVDSGVSGTAMRVYVALARYVDRERKCFPGRRTVAKRLGISPKTFDRAIAELKKVGAVEVEPRFRKNSARSTNLYRLRRVPSAAR